MITVLFIPPLITAKAAVNQAAHTRVNAALPGPPPLMDSVRDLLNCRLGGWEERGVGERRRTDVRAN